MTEQALELLYALGGMCIAIFGVTLCILVEILKQSNKNGKGKLHRG
jgi:hypothetical protein